MTDDRDTSAFTMKAVKKELAMSNGKQSGSDLSRLASSVMRDPHASEIAKSLAASVVAQSHSAKQTGSIMEDKATKVLRSDKYSDTTKSLAGSVLSQSNKNR